MQFKMIFMRYFKSGRVFSTSDPIEELLITEKNFHSFTKFRCEFSLRARARDGKLEENLWNFHTMKWRMLSLEGLIVSVEVS